MAEISVRKYRRSALAPLHALVRPGTYKNFINLALRCPQPMSFLRRYLSPTGDYPHRVRLRANGKTIILTAFTPHDILTINEIFFRRDYPVVKDAEVVVDFGSNIGISAAFFLTVCPKSFVYCFEPLPQNNERLKINLAPWESRYQLTETAVADRNGTMSFGVEVTGRYGGIGVKSANQIKVETVDANEVLERIIARHGRIDLLKIDIEKMEQLLVQRLPSELHHKIAHIVVENRFDDNPLHTTHTMRYHTPVTEFIIKI